MVYDSVHNRTWLADANLAASNTFNVSGILSNGGMNWNTAQNWITAMNTANYLGFNDWRLPTALNFDGTGPCGPAFNCTLSELGNMFYGDLNTGLGGTAGVSIIEPSFHNDNYNLFRNIQSFVYWSGTEFSPGSPLAWYFSTTMASSATSIRAVRCSRGPCAPAMSPTFRSSTRARGWVL